MFGSKQQKKVLIFGVFGQDGTILANLLRSSGAKVFGVSNSKINYPKDPEVHNLFYGDYSNPKLFNDLVSHIHPDVILHFAAIHSNSNEMERVETEQKLSMEKCHVCITQNILDWQKYYPECKALIALSSFIFTPQVANQMITFHTPFSPQGKYGETKYLALKLIKENRKRYGTQTSGLILFNHSSVFSKEGFLIPTIAGHLAQVYNQDEPNRPFIIYNSEKLVDISDANEFCKGFLLIQDQEFSRDWIFSSGKMVSIRSLYENTAQRLNLNLDGFIEFDYLGGDIPSMFGQIDETKSKLGWKGGGDVIEIIKQWFEIYVGS